MGNYTNEPNNNYTDPNYTQPNYQTYQTPPAGYQPPYQVPPVQPYFDPTTQVMSVGQYLVLFILSSIPVVNIICWIVWLCSATTNQNKKNFIKAMILMWVIGVVIMIGYIAIFGAAAGMALGF